MNLGKSLGRTSWYWVKMAILGIILSTTSPSSLGCSATSGDGLSNPRESLPEALNDFHAHLLWARYSEAAGYLPVQEQTAFISGHNDELSDVRYTEYQIGQVNLNYEGDEAVVWVTLTWFREPDYTIQYIQLVEIWRLDEETEYWWLVERSDPDTYEANLEQSTVALPGD